MDVLTRFWRALGRFCGHEARGHQWIMQDGAAPHTARRVLTWLTDHFEGRVVSRFTEKTWASHSPGLNPLDFFLWGHLKDQMSGEQFQTLNDLKSLVESLIRAVTPEQSEDTIQHFCSECGDVFREMVAILNSFYKVVQMENRYMFLYKIFLLTIRMVLLYFCKSVLHYTLE